jgi:DNA-binding HxlR family transcriptional regulator
MAIIGQLVQLLSRRWILTVLAELVDSGRRYQDLHQLPVGINLFTHRG